MSLLDEREHRCLLKELFLPKAMHSETATVACRVENSKAPSGQRRAVHASRREKPRGEPSGSCAYAYIYTRAYVSVVAA